MKYATMNLTSTLFLLTLFFTTTWAQTFFGKTHIYSLDKESLFYMNLSKDLTFRIQDPTYTSNYASGMYSIMNDSLLLLNIENKYSTSPEIIKKIETKLSTFFISDSLLIPNYNVSDILQNYVADTSYSSYGLFSTKESFSIKLNTNGSYVFTVKQGDFFSKRYGNWRTLNNVIKLFPIDVRDDLSYFISENRKLIQINNHLIGITKNIQRKIDEFNYLSPCLSF